MFNTDSCNTMSLFACTLCLMNFMIIVINNQLYSYSFFCCINCNVFPLLRYASDDSEEQTVLESMKEYLLTTIERTFEVGSEQAERLYYELLQCTRKKNLVRY